MVGSRSDLLWRVRNRAEPGVAMTFDQPQLGVEMVIDYDTAIHSAARSDNLRWVDSMQSEHGGKREDASVDGVAAQGHAGSACIDDYGREHSERMSPNTLIGIALLRITDVGQFADES
jgi:hypothetical protein